MPKTTTLILHQGALGDWVLVMPLIRALIDQGHHVVAGQSHAKAILASKLVPTVEPLDIDTSAWAQLFSPRVTPEQPVQKRLSQATHIISFLSQSHDTWAGNVRHLAPHAKLFCLDPRLPENTLPYQHLTAYHAQTLKQQGLFYEPMPANAPVQNTKTSLPKKIIIHPGSGGQHKCWPLASWEVLFDQINPLRWKLIPLLGEVELDTWPADTLEHWMRQYHAIPCHTLDGLYHQLTHADGMIGVDSGPSHLSAAMGLLTLTLFGPTHPAVWAPFGFKAHIIAPPTPAAMSWLTPQLVLDKMSQVF